jgi:hypothetical protein
MIKINSIKTHNALARSQGLELYDGSVDLETDAILNCSRSTILCGSKTITDLSLESAFYQPPKPPGQPTAPTPPPQIVVNALSGSSTTATATPNL